MNNRVSKDNYYLDIALDVAKRSTCVRRCYGAVIVNNDEIISTGYNGAPRGEINCIDCGTCLREEFKIISGENYELARSVHAEANAIISASRKDMIGATLYLAGFEYSNPDVEQEISYPCKMCQRLIINAGIRNILYRKNGEIQIKNVNTFDHDNIISKKNVITIAKLCMILDKIIPDEISDNERIFINEIYSKFGKDNIGVNILHEEDKYNKRPMNMFNNISYAIKCIYSELISDKKYNELSSFVKSSINTKFYNINQFPYSHKGNIDDKGLMESILRYLTDEDDPSKFINLVKSDFGENLVHFTISNVDWYILNSAWYLFYKLKDAIIVFD